MARLDPAQIKARLAMQSRDLLALLLPGGRQVGHEYRARGPDGSTWAVVTEGHKAGHWITGQGGLAGQSLLSLIRDVCCEGDHKRAFRFALSFIGEVPGPLPSGHAAASPHTKRPSQPGDNGMGIYLHAHAFEWGNPVGLYLQGRGIDPGLLERPPRTLRYHPALWCDEVRAHLPAMVAAINAPDSGQQTAIHRTWLAGPPWRKAPLETPKKVRGSSKGGSIHLTRGTSGKPWRQAPDGDRLLLAEGIENALAVACDEPDWRAAAYVASNNLLALRLPAVFRDICLVVDRDGENWSVTEDREIALEQWRLEGRRVWIWEPPPDTKDAADYVKGTPVYG